MSNVKHPGSPLHYAADLATIQAESEEATKWFKRQYQEILDSLSEDAMSVLYRHLREPSITYNVVSEKGLYRHSWNIRGLGQVKLLRVGGISTVVLRSITEAVKAALRNRERERLSGLSSQRYRELGAPLAGLVTHTHFSPTEPPTLNFSPYSQQSIRLSIPVDECHRLKTALQELRDKESALFALVKEIQSEQRSK